MRITDPANRSSDMKRVIAILTFLLSLIVSLHADNPQSADDFIPAILSTKPKEKKDSSSVLSTQAMRHSC